MPLFDKLLSRLLIHCMQNAQDEDVVSILDRAKNGKFAIDDLIHLNTVDIEDLKQEPTQELVQLTDIEKQAVAMYKEYEKLARQDREKKKAEQSRLENNSRQPKAGKDQWRRRKG